MVRGQKIIMETKSTKEVRETTETALRKICDSLSIRDLEG